MPRVAPRHHAIRLSRGGLLLIAALLATLLIASAIPAPALAALSAFGLTATAAAALTTSFGLAATRRTGLRAELIPSEAPPSRGALPRLHVGHPGRVGIRFSPASAHLAAWGRVGLEGSAGLACTPALPADPMLSHGAQITARRVGYAHIHGVRLEGPAAGAIFDASLRIPTFLTLRVLPPTATQRSATLFDATRAASDSSRDVVLRRQRGSGHEVRELREFVTGDPYKHIAWRATARRGRVMVRELETDARLSAWILVDVSPSMSWGAAGLAPLDRAIELATMASSALLAGHDRVGLILHDHRVRLVIEPAHGAAQRQAIAAGLLEAHHLCHEDRTELTHDELLRAIEGWFHLQDGRLFRLPGGLFRGPAPRASPIDEGRLLDACEDFLLGDGRNVAPPPPPCPPLSPEPSRARLRAFCRAVGVELPMEVDARPGGQAQGLLAALETLMRMASRGHGRAQTVIAISDLMTAHDPLALKRIALASRRARHQLVFVVPARRWDDPRPLGAAPSHLVDRVLRAQRSLDAHRHRETEAWLRPAGATFVHVDPEEGLARALARIRAAS